MLDLDVPGDDLFAPGREVTTCYRSAGDPADPTVFLIAGLGEDLTAWTGPFVRSLVAQGLHVVAMDNRDAGRSTFLRTPPPALWRQVLAVPRPEAYSLREMAGDVVALLDHLGTDRAHLVGRSMGGMVAQSIAAQSPERVASLTSIYSTTGHKKVGPPAWSTMALLAAPPAKNRTQAVRSHLLLTKHVAGTAHPIDDVAEAQIAARTWDRCSGDQAAGVARQIEAIHRSGDRTTELAGISTPTLVINGDRDLLVAPTGGAATVQAIRGAQHVVIPGMGHHIPVALVEPITQHIAQHVTRVSQGGTHVQIH